MKAMTHKALLLGAFALSQIWLRGGTSLAQSDAAPPPSSCGCEETVKELRTKLAGLDARLRENEASVAALTDEETNRPERTIEVYGFFDFSLFKWWIPSRSSLHGVQADKSSFTVTHLNFYLSSQLTQTLSSLVELRFSYLPLGYEKSYAPYERVDTFVVDALTTEEYKLGGVGIERAQFTFQPLGWLGVTAGRYLTPFGIWNVDHGSPVLLTVLPPFFMLRQALPLSQTGLIVHGQVGTGATHHGEYALTVSNGRSPTEAVYDLDENKAIGLRLRYRLEADRSSLALGAYGYIGKTTDVTKALATSGSFHLDTIKTKQGTERGGALDLLVRLFDLRLQAEYVRVLTSFDINPPRANTAASPSVSARQPSFIRWNVYGLVAYDFTVFTDIRVTPLVMVERYVDDDTRPDLAATLYQCGLDIYPSSFLVLKAMLTVAVPDEGSLDRTSTDLAFQAAVSF